MNRQQRYLIDMLPNPAVPLTVPFIIISILVVPYRAESTDPQASKLKRTLPSNRSTVKGRREHITFQVNNVTLMFVIKNTNRRICNCA